MLKIQLFPVNPLQENCYIVSDETLECIIIDCGAFYEQDFLAIDKYIKDNGLKPVHLLNTHLHFDHVWGNQYIHDKYGLNTEASTRDQYLYNDVNGQIKQFMGMMPSTPFNAIIAKDLDEGDVITFGSHELKVIATPGHTPGGICFYCEKDNVLFSGDSLFCQSIGRTDLPGGSFNDLINSLTGKILLLPEETIVYSGHGPKTNIKDEKMFNPYL